MALTLDCTSSFIGLGYTEILFLKWIVMNTLILIFLLQWSSVEAAKVASTEGVQLSDGQFPWQLVVDRGKILGCVYDNKFYSLGSVLILESLPRKCELASDRNGVWSLLTAQEMQEFEARIKAQQRIEEEAIFINGKAITEEEIRLIRYLRHSKKRAQKVTK